MLIFFIFSVLQVYDIEEGKVIHKTAAHKDFVHSVAYSRDGMHNTTGLFVLCTCNIHNVNH